MNKTTVGIVFCVLAIVIGGSLIIFGSKEDKNPATSSSDHSMVEETGEEATTSEQPAAAATQTSSVEIKDFSYGPAKIQVKRGTTVTWTNQDSDRHDIMPDKDSNDFRGSELLSKGESYSFTFDKAGTYTYHCTPHPYMKGTVVVTE